MNKFNEVAQTVLEEESATNMLNNFLKEKGLQTADLFTVERYIQKIIAEYIKSLKSTETLFK
jgi:hypothetical protein